jgi:D-serine deaminase-like pyridoxal phosphate-dependent protein
LITSNIERTKALLNGDIDRWRVHIKTAKLGYTVHMLIEHGVRNFKCATTLELMIACDAGAADVLLAYPIMGANARRVREIADQFPRTRISVLGCCRPTAMPPTTKSGPRVWCTQHAGRIVDEALPMWSN